MWHIMICRSLRDKVTLRATMAFRRGKDIAQDIAEESGKIPQQMIVISSWVILKMPSGDVNKPFVYILNRYDSS